MDIRSDLFIAKLASHQRQVRSEIDFCHENKVEDGRMRLKLLSSSSAIASGLLLSNKSGVLLLISSIAY